VIGHEVAGVGGAVAPLRIGINGDVGEDILVEVAVVSASRAGEFEVENRSEPLFDEEMSPGAA
jgi:hypothetical protein